jgi:hypothetical protein
MIPRDGVVVLMLAVDEAPHFRVDFIGVVIGPKDSRVDCNICTLALSAHIEVHHP